MPRRHERDVVHVNVPVDPIYHPNLFLVGSDVDAVTRRAVWWPRRWIRDVRHARRWRLRFHAVQHLAAPLIAGAGGAHLKPEQPIDIGKYVLFIVGDGDGTEALTERPDFPDHAVRAGVGDIDVWIGQNFEVHARAIPIHPRVVRPDTQDGMIVRSVLLAMRHRYLRLRVAGGRVDDPPTVTVA